MEGLFTLIGVIVGAAVAIYSPILVGQIQERNRAKRLLKALLVELQENEHVARTVVEQVLPFDYLSNSINSISYEQAKASGVLADIPLITLKNLMDTYEMASRFNNMLGRPAGIKDREKFIKIYEALPEKFSLAAERLTQYIENKKTDEEDRATQSQEIDLKSVRSILDTILTIPAPEWIDKYLFRALFIIAVLFFVTITIFASYQIPLSSSYTEAVRASYLFNSLAALIGLMTAYWFSSNRWIALLITAAIELFLSGMFFELITFIEKAHF